VYRYPIGLGGVYHYPIGVSSVRHYPIGLQHNYNRSTKKQADRMSGQL